MNSVNNSSRTNNTLNGRANNGSNLRTNNTLNVRANNGSNLITNNTLNVRANNGSNVRANNMNIIIRENNRKFNGNTPKSYNESSTEITTYNNSQNQQNNQQTPLYNQPSNNNIIIEEKNHYFIGYMFHNKSVFYPLVEIQKKLRKKYKLQDSHWNNKLFGNLIYLGYIDKRIMKLYIANILGKLLNSISKKIAPIKCKYNRFFINDDKKYHKICLKFEDEKGVLKNTIIPYLFNEGISPIFNRKKNSSNPEIDILYYKPSEEMSKYVKMYSDPALDWDIPKNTFTMDNISILKGIPVDKHSGRQSPHNRLMIEEVETYPLHGSYNGQ